MQQPWIEGGMRVKIEQIKGLLEGLPLASSVSITKPSELAKELFTHKGSGTLVRRGERVLQGASWADFDLPRLRGLIDSAFGRKLLPDYFECTQLHRAYVSENYRAAVILTQEDAGIYLDKFAVLDDAQGEGLGRAVWLVMREQNPMLFWRSRHGNAVNPFYYAESDGCIKQDKWKVYWYGRVGFDRIERYVQLCAKRPATLKNPYERVASWPGRCARPYRRGIDSLDCRTPALELAFVTSARMGRSALGGPQRCLLGAIALLQSSARRLANPRRRCGAPGAAHGKASAIVQAFDAAGVDPILIDLSADYRFDPGWYYGLPELTRHDYAGQRRISNPGCYATAMQLAIAPMRTVLDGPVQCFGVSGYSGAGTTPMTRTMWNCCATT